MKQVLHVGSGPPNPNKLHPRFRVGGWREIRLDIDPAMQPDIVAGITSMPMVADDSMDAVWSSHNLEHLYAHEVPLALREFYRVLKPGGHLLLTLPDLQAVAKLVAEDRLEEIAYIAPAGPVAALDMLYGFRPSLARGNLHMAHRTGFTARSLAVALERAGFQLLYVKREPEHFALRTEGKKLKE
jgi:SAM-dependent methyltransferase